jgi:cysteinyl-tRNA synthetase
MTLHLTNTLTRQKEAFSPATAGRVTMYVCGPTVYNYAHIGNARPAVVFDVLYRLLKRRYGIVLYARNFTDVDDKINAVAAARGEHFSVVTERFISAYQHDMAALGVLPPDLEPRVTGHIPEIIAMIGQLIMRKHAYVTEGHVLFDVQSFPGYGQLSGMRREDMVAGERVEVAPYKKDPADFVLWKPSGPELPGWPSPWGRGRPGWHIECSAMIDRHLGHTIDIHGGGQDLVFPHHENEIAQGTCAHDGADYCRYWLHNGFVTVDKRKMSKSLGNVLLVRDLLDQAPGEAIRLALLSAHYRQPLDWNSTTLSQAARSLDRLYAALDESNEAGTVPAEPRLLSRFEAALDDDLNFPAALAELFSIARHARGLPEAADRARYKAALRAAGSALGILGRRPRSSKGQESGASQDETASIQALLDARAAARARRDFASADQLRVDLAALGVVVEDHADGAVWRQTSQP